MLRNNQTNMLLGSIARLHDKKMYPDTPITMIVNGILISGTIINEDEYYSLELNNAHKGLYEIAIKEPQEKYFGENAEEIAKDDIPDHLCQQFIYLKNAYYVFGDKTIPSIGNSGISIQVRLADVSAFNFGNLNFSQS
jgi:hypothetical protein